jgi:hypothetical protein
VELKFDSTRKAMRFMASIKDSSAVNIGGLVAS